MKKKYLKLNNNDEHLSLGNLFRLIKEIAKVKTAALQTQIFCTIFEVDNINDTTVNNYCVGYRGIGNEYKQIMIYKEKRYRDLSAIVSPYYSEYSMSEYSRGDDVDSVTVAHLYTLFNNIKEQRNVSDIIEELEPIYASLESDYTYSAYANDIALNIALAYIKDDQTDKAIIILKKLEADNPDTPIAVKAKELKKKLQTD